MSIAAAELDILNGKIIDAIPRYQIDDEDIIGILSECVKDHEKIIT